MNDIKRKNMENKQYPPRGGPPLVYRCRGIPFGTRVFLTAHFSGWCGFRRRHPLPGQTAHLEISPSRIEEDVGPPGWQNRNSNKGIAVGFPEGMAMPNQRITKAFARTGLQPHSTMRLKPGELPCSFLIRQLKQTAMEEKQLPISNKVSRTARNTRHVGKSRDKPAVVFKPIGKMRQRVGNTGPPPGRTGQNDRKDSRQVWKYDSGGGKYPLGVRKHSFGYKKHPFGDKKHPFGDWKYSFGDWNDSLGDWNDSLGDWNDSLRDWKYPFGDWNDSLGDWNDSLGDWNDSLWNWKDAGPPGGLSVLVWNPSLEGLKSRNKAREPAGQTPEKVCRSGIRMERAPVSRTGRRDGAGLGSRNVVASQPEHPSEWERYAKKRRKCRMMNNEYRMLNKEQENNIPVLRTFGYNADSNSTNITGALHLEFFSRFVALNPPAAAPRNTLSGNRRIWNEKPAAAPRNICSNECYPFGMKVQRTETLIENVEYRIMNNESGRKNPLWVRSIPEGLHVYRQPISRENTTPAGVERLYALWYFYKHLMPLASGRTG